MFDVVLQSSDAAAANPSKSVEEQAQKAIGKVLEEATYKKKTGTGLEIYEKEGGMDAAQDNFDSMPLSNKKVYDEGTQVGQLPNGQKVNVRSQSTDGRPTLEIQTQNGKPIIKIRYKE